uniref:Globin family profile domain-containing protein n=1 Tax=Caenorhabditis japonica TaxID=281687 RepID=A0A8R1HUL1_CAEJA
MHSARIQQFVRRLQRPSIQGDHVFISSKYTRRLFICEQEEVTKLIESYQRIDDKYALFEEMFLTIFLEQEVEMAYSFGLENLNEAQLKTEQKIVGRQHGNVRTMSFTAEKWLIFKNVLLELLCKDANEKVCATWNKLISFMISEVKDSYLEHVRHARSSSCPQINSYRFIASRSKRLRPRKHSESANKLGRIESGKAVDG